MTRQNDGESMGVAQLTAREQLIERILHMSDDEGGELLDITQDLHDDAKDEIRADSDQWDRQFAKSQDQLAQLGEEALAEYRAGKTRPIII